MNKLYRNYKLKVAFSKAAPQDAFSSAGRLLHCALLPIRAKCGLEAADFVREYVTRFTAAVDPKCVLDNKATKPALPRLHLHQLLQKAVLWAARRRLTFCHKVRWRGTFHSSISISVSSQKKQFFLLSFLSKINLNDHLFYPFLIYIFRSPNQSLAHVFAQQLALSASSLSPHFVKQFQTLLPVLSQLCFESAALCHWTCYECLGKL